MHSLNPVGAIVAHFDVFGDGTPLCGFIATNLDGVDVAETVTADWSSVSCRDCLAARDGHDGPDDGNGSSS